MEHIHASEAETQIEQDFYPPDRTTPIKAVKTFWWALKLNNEMRIKECIKEDLLLEEYEGWTLEAFLDPFRFADPRKFHYSTEHNFVRITSPEHTMDYQMELDDEGMWRIIRMTP